MDSIDTKSKVSSTAVIPSGGTRKSRSGGGGEGEISFASLLNGGGFGDIKSGGGLQSGLEDSLGSALDRNPDEAPEKAPEQTAKNDYNEDAPDRSNDDGYYNKADNRSDSLNDRTDDIPHDDTSVTSANDDHSSDFNGANDEPAHSEAQSAQHETSDNNNQPANNNANEEQSEQSAGDNSTVTTAKSETNTNTNSNGGATVATLNELAQNQALPEQAAATAGTKTKDAEGKANAANGLNNAAAAISADKTAKPGAVKQAAGNNDTTNQAKTGEGINQSPESDGKKKSAKNTSAATANANATAKPQDQLQNQQAAQPKAETQTRETSNAAKQAAEISRAIGGDKDVSINVSVQSEKDTLVSRPRSSLSTEASKATTSLNNANAGQQQGQNQSANNQMAGQNMAGQNMAIAAQQAQAQAQAKQGPAGGVNNAANAVTGAQASSAASGDGGALNSTPSFSETLNARQASAPAKTPNAHQNTPAAKSPATEQVSVQITKAINAGADKINIHLRPASLGRVDVQIEMGMDGRVSAVVTADNKDTLDLLQRDQRALERALQDAGLKADSGSLSFNLRGGGEGGNSSAEANNASAPAPLAKPEIEEEPLESLLTAQFDKQEKGIGDGRIDIHA